MAAGPQAVCTGCTFYRHEPAPENWGVNGFYGPPYGLLQGGITGLTRSFQGVENPGLRPVRRGTAAFIGGGADFFIGTVDHSEWGGAFTVFAQAEEEDLAKVVPLIPLEPYRNSTDAYNFTTRWLLNPIAFRLEPLRRADLLVATARGAADAKGDTL